MKLIITCSIVSVVGLLSGTFFIDRTSVTPTHSYTHSIFLTLGMFSLIAALVAFITMVVLTSESQ